MKKYVLAVSALAFVAAKPALAFDTINWNWDADVQTNIATTAAADVSVAPTGLEQVESEQVSLGASAATASSLGITNSLTMMKSAHDTSPSA